MRFCIIELSGKIYYFDSRIRIFFREGMFFGEEKFLICCLWDLDFEGSRVLKLGNYRGGNTEMIL